MNKPTKKEIYLMSGKAESACIILSELLKQLYGFGDLSHNTKKATIEAKMACEKTRSALRAISYEVENGRKNS